jgi:hypothetical protein
MTSSNQSLGESDSIPTEILPFNYTKEIHRKGAKDAEKEEKRTRISG